MSFGALVLSLDPQVAAAGGQGDTDRGSGADWAGGHSVRSHHGTHRLCRHQAPSEPLQDRCDPVPGTGGKLNSSHKTPVVSPWLAGPCSEETEWGDKLGAASFMDNSSRVVRQRN